MSYAEDLLAECFAEAGLDPDKAILAARVALRVGLAAGIVPRKALAAWEEGARAYALRGLPDVSARVVAVRIGAGERAVFKMTKRHLARVQAAKRAAKAA